MSKAVLISIQPKWCELIASGKKTIEVRKNRPSIKTPFKCYIYETKANRKQSYYNIYHENTIGKIVGEFVCDEIYPIKSTFRGYIVNDNIALTNRIGTASCLDLDDMRAYLGNKNGYAWNISDLVIYDKPRELGEFERQCFDNFYKGIGSKICHKCDQYLRTTMYEPCDCKNDGYKPLTRPPQSWCYVAEEV